LNGNTYVLNITVFDWARI